MQLVRGAHRRLRPGDDRLDRRGIQPAEPLPHLDREPAAHRDRARAALLQGGVVQERVGVGAQDLVREHARLGRVERDDADLAAAEALEQRAQALHVHQLGEAIADRLADQGVVGRIDVRADAVVVLAAGLLGEDGEHQIVGAHPLQRGGDLAAAAEAEERERAGRGPAEAGAEHRALEHRLHEHVLQALGADQIQELVGAQAVLGGQREEHAVVGRGGLELEIEGAAEALAEREAQRAVQPAAEGGVHDELRAAGLVEEALDDQGRLRGDGAEGGAAGGDVLGGEQGAAGVDRALGLEPGRGGGGAVRGGAGGDGLAEGADLAGELGGARGGLADPEGDRGGLAARVLDPDAAGLDALDAPGGVAEEEDVAGHGFDREVLVEGADLRGVGLEEDVVGRGVGDGAAGGERGDAGAAAAAEAAAHGVAVDEGAGAAAAARDALGDHRDDRVEVLARERLVMGGAAGHGEELVLAALLAGARGDDLLGEHVERGVAEREAVELAAAGGAHDGGALEELVAREGEEAAPRGGAEGVARAAYALEGDADGAGGADEARELDGADVDAELERGGRDDDAQVAGLEAGLGGLAARAGEAAVVGRDGVLAEALAEVVGDALDEAPRVDEDEGRARARGERGEAVVDLAPLLGRAHGAELVARGLDREVEVAALARVDDLRQVARADEQAGGDLEGAHGRGEADALRPRAARARDEVLQALQGEREVGAALVGGHGVDLVHDHRAHAGERAPARVAGEQDEGGLGRGDEHVRRAGGRGAAVARGRVARADRDPDAGRAEAVRPHRGRDLLDGPLEVPVHVAGEGLEGRDVEHLGPVLEAALGRADQPVEAVEKGRERLARAGGRRDERVPAARDRGPGARLHRRRGPEAPSEPRLDCGVEHPPRVPHDRGTPHTPRAAAALPWNESFP